jgi:hypothetical protein
MSLMLASSTNTMSAVFPAVLSRVSRALLLRFVLWDMMRRVAADESYLFISGHGGIVDRVRFGGDRVGWGSSSCFLPCCTDDSGLDWAVRVVGGVEGISVACFDAVGALVGGVVAGAAASCGAIYTGVIVSGVGTGV